MNPSDNKRIDYIDIIKGIAIFLVVWGHSIQYGGTGKNVFEDKCFTFIYSFHMPLFMILSGYVFAKTIYRKKFYEIIKNKIVHLAFPAIFWGILFYIIKVIVENYLLKNVFLFSFREMFQGIWNVWFLWSVFFCTIIVLLVEYMKKKYMCLITLLLGFIMLYFLPNGDLNVFMFPYFLVGYIWEKNEDIPAKCYCLCLILFPLLLSYYSKEHYIYVSGIMDLSDEIGVGRQIEIDIFRWVIGLVGSISIIMIVKYFLKDVSSECRIRKMFCEFGKYTLEIYVMQRILIEYLGTKVMWKIINETGFSFLHNEIIYDYIYTLLCTVFFLVILYFMAVFYRNLLNQIKVNGGKRS